MTTPEALTALADRVEREEPSRTLDFWIYVALNPGKDSNEAIQGDIDKVGIEGMWNPHHYTTSLDSAVTLVPEGLTWMAQGSPNVALIRRGNHLLDKKPMIRGKGKTPAAALTSAALRARAADMQARAEDGAPHPAPSGNEGHDQ